MRGLAGAASGRDSSGSRLLLSRLLVLAGVLGTALIGCGGSATTPSLQSPSRASERASNRPASWSPLLDSLQRRTFAFFWESTRTETGLTPDRWPSEPFASVAAMGFALTAYPVGVERGYVTRARAVRRVARTLEFLWNAPQHEGARGASGYRGFFYRFLDYDYEGYNEAMILYILALGSPTHPIDASAWPAYVRTYEWAEFYGQEHVNFAPLFGHQYSHIWVDFREIQDPYMREKGITYFENSERAVRAQRAYAIENPNVRRGLRRAGFEGGWLEE